MAISWLLRDRSLFLPLPWGVCHYDVMPYTRKVLRCVGKVCRGDTHYIGFKVDALQGSGSNRSTEDLVNIDQLRVGVGHRSIKSHG